MAVKLVESPFSLTGAVGYRITSSESSDSQDKSPFPLVLGGHMGFQLKSNSRPAELRTLRDGKWPSTIGPMLPWAFIMLYEARPRANKDRKAAQAWSL